MTMYAEENNKWITVGVTAAAIGIGAYVVYRYQEKVEQGNKQVLLKVTLEKKHVQFIEDMAAQHTGGDSDAVMRALLDHAMLDAAESTVFGKVRCNTCGGKKDKTSSEWQVLAKHDEFLSSMSIKHKLKDSKHKALRCICEFAMSEVDPSEIFRSGQAALS